LETALLFVETQQEGVTRLQKLLNQMANLLKDSPAFGKNQDIHKNLMRTFKTFEQEALKIISHANS